MYCCGNTNEFKFILSTRDGVYGIIIPCQIGQVKSVPELVELQYIPHFFSWDRTYFGYNSAVIISDLFSWLMMIYYSWPEDSSEPLGPSYSLIGKVDEETWRCSSYSAFDESSGRAVVVDAGNKLVVYDFAKFKNVSCTVD